ncbi:MAG: hypothetical protein LBE24_00740 [Methylobacillus sp.]|jgi:hypothetical protein|nr:hypothetical protein [Methylobacillus sp.]
MKNLRNLFTVILIAALTTACAHAPKSSESSVGWLKDQNGCAVYHSPGQANDSVRWSGECRNGYAEGHGVTEWFAYGERIEIDTIPRLRGKLHGKGTVVWGYDHYVGEATNDLRHGKGVYVWSNGDFYEGDWVADNRTGYGTLFFVNGDRYQGNWVNEQWSGQGIYTVANGRSFQGNFKDGYADGEGIIIEPDGTRHPGNIDEILGSQGGCSCGCGCDAMSGHDEEEATGDPSWITDENGCTVYNPMPQKDEFIVWNGACQDGYAQGSGVLMWFVDGELDSTSTGTWEHGKLNGMGTVITSDGWSYEGDFVDDEPTGQGVYTRPDGTRFEGKFVNGIAQGDGIITEPGGARRTGNFDEFISQ